MLIVYWPITIKFRIPSKPQNHKLIAVYFLQFSYLSPYWLISRNTITFHKYFWCLRFCEFHSNNFDNNEKILFIVNNVDPHIYRLTAAYIHIWNIDKNLFFNNIIGVYFDLRSMT